MIQVSKIEVLYLDIVIAAQPRIRGFDPKSDMTFSVQSFGQTIAAPSSALLLGTAISKIL